MIDENKKMWLIGGIILVFTCTVILFLVNMGPPDEEVLRLKARNFINISYNFQRMDEIEESFNKQKEYFDDKYYTEYFSYKIVDLSGNNSGIKIKDYNSEAVNKKLFFGKSKVYIYKIVVQPRENKVIVCFYLDLGDYSEYVTRPGYAIIIFNKDLKVIKLEENF